jgi:hypothetical protein
MDCLNCVPLLFRHSSEALITEYTGIRDEDVHPAKLFQSNPDQSVAVFR